MMTKFAFAKLKSIERANTMKKKNNENGGGGEEKENGMDFGQWK